MKINSVNNSTSFSGAYKVNLPVQDLQTRMTKIEFGIVDFYKKIRHRPIFNFVDPTQELEKEILDRFAKENGASLDWLRMNAQNFGIKIPNFDTNTMYVITEKEDLEKLFKELKPKKKAVKKLFKSFKDSSDLPNHLKNVRYIVDRMSIIRQEFEKILNFKEVKDEKELLYKLMLEK